MRRKSLRSLILLLTALNIGAMSFYVFIRMRIDVSQARIVEAREEYRDVERRQDRITDMARLADDIYPLAVRLREALISADGMIDFIETLEIVAESVGVGLEIQSVEIRESTDKLDFVEVASVEMIAQGIFDNVESIIDALENLPLALSLNRVGLERIGVDDSDEWRALLSLRVLKLK